MKILLVGNYAPDRQQSMLRFAATLERELIHAGIDVETLRPVPIFGKFFPTSRGLEKWLGYLDKFVVFPRVLKKRIAGVRDTVVHICDHSNAIYTRELRDIPHLATCNDLLAIRCARGEFLQNRTRWSGRILQGWIARGLRHARRIACISEATREDLLRVLPIEPSRTAVIPMGLNFPYRPMPRDAAARRLEKLRAGLTSRPFILHVGGDQWYKNRAGVLRIHSRLREARENAPALVMVGPAPNPALQKLASNDVLFFPDVGNEDLCALYSCAELLLFPSIAEGFGWPIAEAMACGCRVVTTNRAPMTEVGGDAAIYLDADFENGDWIERAAKKVAGALNEDAIARKTSIQAGLEQAHKFSTEKMIERYLAEYRELARTQ